MMKSNQVFVIAMYLTLAFYAFTNGHPGVAITALIVSAFFARS